MQSWIALVLACALGLALGALICLRVLARRERREGRARNTRGKRGEERAAALLERAGYRIVERQRRSSYRLQTDTTELDVGVTFDFVVARDGRELIAEVKTGILVTQLRHADTRRQLLEYQLVSGAAEVLLVDPDRQSITSVSFPLPGLPESAATAPQPWSSAPRALALCSALLASALALYAWWHAR